ncbi:porin [Vibrio crassostreae]|uniref:porin n=1 Tax=Vibrio crassostreae TaxID=246167 RepID=UPI001B306876|nr:porin [Vibrio crassostreae]
MKKTILATLVGFMAVGAQAAEVTPTADVYGQVGIAVDAFDGVAVGEETEINATRNTEFGIRGGAAINEAFKADYDLRVGFTADKEAELSRANVKIAHDKFFVTAGIAESSFDNATSKMDVFDSTFTGEFEVFDRVRASEMVTLGVTPVAGLEVAIDFAGKDFEAGDLVAEQEIGDEINLAVTYQVKGFDLGLGYKTAALTEVEDQGTPVGDIDMTSAKFGAGYDFAHMGVNGLYVGGVYQMTTVEQGTYSEDLTLASVTAGYELGHGVTLAGGYAIADSDQADDSVNTLRLGVDYAAAKNVVVKAGYAVISTDAADVEDESLLTAGVIYNF